MSDQLVQAIADMRDADAVAMTRQILESSADPMSILDDCRAAMEIVGKRFEAGEYFLPELILAGETLKQIAALVKPRIQQESGAPRGAKIVLGTVQGDIHDIGKDIVGFMLDVNGFQVIDLGVDVPAQVFVEKIAAHKPDMVALSGFLTLAFNSMKNTIAAIQAAGLRDQVKIMVGGGTIDDNVRAYVGADAYGASAIAAVALARDWSK
ncbi:MAG: cobalamin B12-binding domain-containing protein [Chloroflexi bacterium]|nr:cobalamin B12-binding domain-containing protein [Chloroflexota bacterium]